jgi:hypothetical protein
MKNKYSNEQQISIVLEKKEPSAEGSWSEPGSVNWIDKQEQEWLKEQHLATIVNLINDMQLHFNHAMQIQKQLLEVGFSEEELLQAILGVPIPKNWIKEVIKNQFTDQVIDHEKAIVTKYEAAN